MLFAYIFLGMIGGPQIILIIAVVLLLFGGRKIPELMRGLGSGIKEFKNATKEEDEKPQVEESSSKKS
ncbi:MAG: twin-arginine translocase TatA/TatE family subunit [Flavobacteriaceae bacterium]